VSNVLNYDGTGISCENNLNSGVAAHRVVASENYTLVCDAANDLAPPLFAYFQMTLEILVQEKTAAIRIWSGSLGGRQARRYSIRYNNNKQIQATPTQLDLQIMDESTEQIVHIAPVSSHGFLHEMLWQAFWYAGAKLKNSSDIGRDVKSQVRRAIKTLAAADVITVYDLISLSENELWSAYKVSPVVISIFNAELQKYGLGFGFIVPVGLRNPRQYAAYMRAIAGEPIRSTRPEHLSARILRLPSKANADPKL
jgi:hypothetical protein